MRGAGEQGKGSTLKARRESGRGVLYHAWTTSRRVVPQDLGEGLQRGHGASKPPAGHTGITTKQWVWLSWSTGELKIAGEDLAGLKMIESESDP